MLAEKKIGLLVTSNQPRLDRECLWFNEENGGKGLIQPEWTYKTTTKGLKKYLDTVID